MLTRMKVTVVGCSPAWPNPGGAQSGYLVEGSGRLLLDCGPGVLPRLRQQEGWPKVDAIVISHFHLDHWGDVVPWCWGSQYGPGRQVPRAALWVPPTGSRALRSVGKHFGRSAAGDHPPSARARPRRGSRARCRRRRLHGLGQTERDLTESPVAGDGRMVAVRVHPVVPDAAGPIRILERVVEREENDVFLARDLG